MKFDLHTHHNRCGHAEGSISDYINEAIKLGLQVIGISDHSPFFGEKLDHFKPWVAMAKSEFQSYVEEVLRLKEAYQGKIEVLLGVESDYFPEFEALYQNIYRHYPFDYIIGSVHVTNGIDLFNRTRWENITQEQLIAEKEEYYRLIKKSAESHMFDILGHIDALKGFYPKVEHVKTELVDEALKAIAESGSVIEINTSGKTKDCGGWYPAIDMLERAKFYGVQVTYGSDAHHPNRVADDWLQVKNMLKEIGYQEWYILQSRQKRKIAL
ncbi:histidinol-phosphatase [Bacillus sp. NPDC077027]|uniref:histidinol-phosphatase n=1 Tax=Bacillus sp. NPDC077027 TaxID=3390548 RepID=UPI003D04ECCA